MADNDEEHDMYVAQLREVFDSCDTLGQGRLTKNELEQLCAKLQLEDQIEALVQQLLGEDQQGRVGFDTFKEGFVAVLSENVEGLSSEDDLDEDTQELVSTGGSISPKFIRGRKKYGRRTIPDSTTSDLEGTTDLSEYTTSSRHSAVQKEFNSRMSSLDQDEEAFDDQDPAHRRPPVHPNSFKTQTSETFEAEGQMNQNMCDLENALDPVSEEAHLREIWRELGVGQSGYISLHELGTVCEHIGMDEMTHEELSHLFDKLDVDSDGRVSFTEFLEGLFQHGGPNTPSSMTPVSLARITPNRPRSTPQKLRLQHSLDADSRHTPAFVHLGSGLFSALDSQGTGYAHAEAVIELWESLGIRQGADILEFLQFDVRTKVNLADLSDALEKEVRDLDEDNATYQAAVVSYEQELRFLKQTCEQKAAERDKVRQALNEAHTRITILVKEGDDRQVALELAKEKELAELESRCLEQVRGVHADMDAEREALTQQSVKQRVKLEQQIDKLKEEEAKLKEKLFHTQKALEKVEFEMYEVAERAAELEKQNMRMQRQLDDKHELQRKLDELETDRANIIDEQHRFSQQKLEQLEQENKVLKDKSDELTMEIEDLTQKLTMSRKQQHKSPIPTPETLTDKQMRGSASHDSTSEYSGDDTASGRYRIKRRLPQRPGARARSPQGSENSDDIFPEEFSEKLTEIKTSHNHELANLQRGYSVERRELEDAYKLEITQLEDQHMQEKNHIIKQLKKEKEELEGEFAVKLEASLAEKELIMRDMFEEQLQEFKVKTDSERTLLEHAYADEKADVIKRMREEFEEELSNKLAVEKERYEQELEQTVTRDRTDYDAYKKKIAELELHIKLQKEELELAHAQTVGDLQQQFEADRCQLEEKHRIEILGYENMLAQGVVALKGKLKDDFYRLLVEQKAEAVEEEKEKLAETANQERDSLVEEFTRQQEQLVQRYKKDRREMEGKYQIQIQNLEKSLTQEQTKSTTERDQLQLTIEREREHLQLERERLQKEFEEERDTIVLERSHLTGEDELDSERQERERILLEEQIAEELHAQLEDEFLMQMDRLKEAFGEERTQLESRIDMLQDEVDDINRTRDMEDRFRQQMETKGREAVNKYKQQLEELKDANLELQSEKTRIETRLNEIIVEKENVIQAVQIQPIQAAVTSLAPPLQSPPTLHSPSSEHRLDQAILDAIEKQSRLFDDRTSQLQTSITGMAHSQAPRHSTLDLLKQDHERVLEEKAAIHQELLELRAQLVEKTNQGLSSQQAEVKASRWEAENKALMRQLDVTTDKLSTATTALALVKSEHQRELQRMRDSYANTVDANKYNNLHSQLLDARKRTTQLEKALEERADETNKLITGSRDDHGKAVKRLEQEKANLQTKLEVTQNLLDQQVLSNKKQLEASSRTDKLVRDLYVENANLMKCLELSEKRGVNAEKNVYGLEEKCRVLHKVLGKVSDSVALV